MRLDHFGFDLQNYLSEMKFTWPLILIGVGIAVFLHVINRKPKWWPALVAFMIYLFSFLMLFFWMSMASMMISERIGSVSLGFAAGWLTLDFFICRQSRNS